MATTRLSDIVYGPLFLPATLQRTAQLSRLRNSNIVSADPQISAYANQAGDIVQMPFWNDITGDSNVSTDDPAQNAVPAKITQGADTARKIRRNFGVQAANLVASVMADDPLDNLATLIGNYWVREEEKILASVMTGVFADPLMSGNVLNVATEGAPALLVNLDAEVANNAYALLGEYGQTLTGALIHSRVYYNLRAASAIEYGKDPVSGLDFERWDGKEIFVSDALPRVAGTGSGFKYTSYLFGTGAIAYAEATGAGGPVDPVELDSAPAAGNGEGVRTLWYRRHFIIHPRGVAFDGTTVGNSATNAELAAGTSWTRKYDPKYVRMVAVVTNG